MVREVWFVGVGPLGGGGGGGLGKEEESCHVDDAKTPMAGRDSGE